MIKEAPLYSIIEIEGGTIIDGCLFLVEDLKLIETEVHRPVIQEKELKILDKQFFLDLFKKNGMIREDEYKSSWISKHTCSFKKKTSGE